jgi:hypothetical protein
MAGTHAAWYSECACNFKVQGKAVKKLKGAGESHIARNPGISASCSSGQVAAAEVFTTLYSTAAAWLHQAHPQCVPSTATVAAANTTVVKLCLCNWIYIAVLPPAAGCNECRKQLLQLQGLKSRQNRPGMCSTSVHS